VHHGLHHRGLLVIEGETEQAARFSHADGTVYGEAPRPGAVQANAEAHAALRSLGFTETESRDALIGARTHVGAGAKTEELVTAALRARQRLVRAA
jgi:Holliday junction resolvasome RuvABC DNA-binding subunit